VNLKFIVIFTLVALGIIFGTFLFAIRPLLHENIAPMTEVKPAGTLPATNAPEPIYEIPEAPGKALSPSSPASIANAEKAILKEKSEEDIAVKEEALKRYDEAIEKAKNNRRTERMLKSVAKPNMPESESADKAASNQPPVTRDTANNEGGNMLM